MSCTSVFCNQMLATNDTVIGKDIWHCHFKKAALLQMQPVIDGAPLFKLYMQICK